MLFLTRCLPFLCAAGDDWDGAAGGAPAARSHRRLPGGAANATKPCINHNLFQKHHFFSKVKTILALHSPVVGLPSAPVKYMPARKAQQASAPGPARLCRSVGSAGHPHCALQCCVTLRRSQSVTCSSLDMQRPSRASSAQVSAVHCPAAAAGHDGGARLATQVHPSAEPPVNPTGSEVTAASNRAREGPGKGVAVALAETPRPREVTA